MALSPPAGGSPAAQNGAARPVWAPVAEAGAGSVPPRMDPPPGAEPRPQSRAGLGGRVRVGREDTHSRPDAWGLRDRIAML